VIERTWSNLVQDRRALFGDCSAYRYLLEVRVRHEVARGRSLLPVIGLNPSTATERVDDPTIRRELRFALDMGYGGLLKANVAALRSTDPREIDLSCDPIGPGNTVEWLARTLLGEHAEHDTAHCHAHCSEVIVLACWGAHGTRRALAAQVAAIRERFGARLWAFGLTNNGQPMHPLYLRASARPSPLADLEGDLEP
jgi:hypothetical protein